MSTNVNNTLPQGFSVFQPTLGAPLQFFPALGTKLLDDMMNAYVSGSASLQEKRASVSLDFLEYTQKTGQAFKFYNVPGFVANPDSPTFMASPAQPSLSSSLTVSPIASDWDWTSVSGTTSSSKSSHSRSARKSSSSSRHQTAGDFSHMPGMKIMTKEGLDVTNSASRGSKTKEQRDHAHLMRIIKACDSCRRKKIRCDPSHKKKASSQAVSQPAAKASKKARVVVPREQSTAAVPARLSGNMVPPPAPSIALDSFSASADFTQSTAAASGDSWEDFIHYPQEEMDTDYDFFFDPQGFLSPLVSDTSSSASGSKSISPTSQPEFAPTGFEDQHLPVEFVLPTEEQQNVLLPYMDVSGGSNTYTDFNLYSPQSSFSEDDRMLSVASTTPATSSAEGSQLPSPPDRPPSDGAMFGEIGEADLLRVEHGSLPISWQQKTGVDVNAACESYAVMPDDQWHYSELQQEGVTATEGDVQLGGIATYSTDLLETGISDHHESSQPMVAAQSATAIDRLDLSMNRDTSAIQSTTSHDRPLVSLSRDASVNLSATALDRRSSTIHRDPSMNQTESPSTRTTHIQSLGRAVVEPPLSHVETGTTQSIDAQSTPTTRDILQRTTSAVFSTSSPIVGSDQHTETAIASAPLSSRASTTVADLSASSTVAIRSSYRDPGRHVLDATTDDSSARIADPVSPSDAVAQTTMLLHGRTASAPVHAPEVLEEVQTGAFSSLSSSMASPIRMSAVLSSAKVIDMRMVATSGMSQSTDDLKRNASSLHVEELRSDVQAKTVKASPPWTYAIGSCMMVLLAMALLSSTGLVFAMVALSISLYRRSRMDDKMSSISTSMSEGGSLEIASRTNRLGGKISRRANLPGVAMLLLATAR